MNEKLALLIVTFLTLMMTSLIALAVGPDSNTLLSCTYDYTYCSDSACDQGAGADGQHVYQCDTYPYVRTVDTCCGG